MSKLAKGQLWLELAAAPGGRQLQSITDGEQPRCGGGTSALPVNTFAKVHPLFLRPGHVLYSPPPPPALFDTFSALSADSSSVEG